jgi:uncharacterized protein (DUF3084 family)
MLAIPTAQQKFLRAQDTAFKFALDAPAGNGTRVDRHLAAAAGPAPASTMTLEIAMNARSSIANRPAAVSAERSPGQGEARRAVTMVSGRRRIEPQA